MLRLYSWGGLELFWGSAVTAAVASPTQVPSRRRLWRVLVIVAGLAGLVAAWSMGRRVPVILLTSLVATILLS